MSAPVPPKALSEASVFISAAYYVQVLEELKITSLCGVRLLIVGYKVSEDINPLLALQKDPPNILNQCPWIPQSQTSLSGAWITGTDNFPTFDRKAGPSQAEPTVN